MSRSGEYIRNMTGEAEYRSFRPAPLPPEPALEMDDEMLRLLVDQPEVFNTDKAISVEEYRAWLEDINSKPFRNEDVMNHFWEIDNKLVEDTLFWEAVEVDLTKLG